MCSPEESAAREKSRQAFERKARAAFSFIDGLKYDRSAVLKDAQVAARLLEYDRASIEYDMEKQAVYIVTRGAAHA